MGSVVTETTTADIVRAADEIQRVATALLSRIEHSPEDLRRVLKETANPAVNERGRVELRTDDLLLLSARGACGAALAAITMVNHDVNGAVHEVLGAYRALIFALNSDRQLDVSPSEVARMAARARYAKDPKQAAKAFIRECWLAWRAKPSQYPSAAAFARAMLDKEAVWPECGSRADAMQLWRHTALVRVPGSWRTCRRALHARRALRVPALPAGCLRESVGRRARPHLAQTAKGRGQTR